MGDDGRLDVMEGEVTVVDISAPRLSCPLLLMAATVMIWIAFGVRGWSKSCVGGVLRKTLVGERCWIEGEIQSFAFHLTCIDMVVEWE